MTAKKTVSRSHAHTSHTSTVSSPEVPMIAKKSASHAHVSHAATTNEVATPAEVAPHATIPAATTAAAPASAAPVASASVTSAINAASIDSCGSAVERAHSAGAERLRSPERGDVPQRLTKEDRAPRSYTGREEPGAVHELHAGDGHVRLRRTKRRSRSSWWSTSGPRCARPARRGTRTAWTRRGSAGRRSAP